MYFIKIHKCNDSLRTSCIKVVDEGRERDKERKEKGKKEKFRMPERYQTLFWKYS